MSEKPDMKLTWHRNQCPTCHDYFNSDTAFDKHRIGDFNDPADPRRCMTVDEMEKAGMSRNKAGFWITKKRSAK